MAPMIPSQLPVLASGREDLSFSERLDAEIIRCISPRPIGATPDRVFCDEGPRRHRDTLSVKLDNFAQAYVQQSVGSSSAAHGRRGDVYAPLAQAPPTASGPSQPVAAKGSADMELKRAVVVDAASTLMPSVDERSFGAHAVEGSSANCDIGAAGGADLFFPCNGADVASIDLLGGVANSRAACELMHNMHHQTALPLRAGHDDLGERLDGVARAFIMRCARPSDGGCGCSETLRDGFSDRLDGVAQAYVKRCLPMS
eukprot:TRINITY_DN57263_c0_g1_i1.p1 TRINITY_DN57263_c0_g1~~TRINITY_DN57263_c0_g1_i1.p1  ORF type:complete len:273 (-),score=50.93 TRINITY_DN57263_c0_g1_i1:139-909(-)